MLPDLQLPRVTIETQFTPPIVIDRISSGGEQSLIMRLLKPRVSAAGMVIEPAGAPQHNYFPLAVGAVVVISALAAFGLYSLIKG